jgi:hypothetical protein
VRTKVGWLALGVTIVGAAVEGLFDCDELGARDVTLCTPPWVNLIWFDMSGVNVRMLLPETSTVLVAPLASARFEAETTFRQNKQHHGQKFRER